MSALAPLGLAQDAAEQQLETNRLGNVDKHHHEQLGQSKLRQCNTCQVVLAPVLALLCPSTEGSAQKVISKGHVIDASITQKGENGQIDELLYVISPNLVFDGLFWKVPLFELNNDLGKSRQREVQN